MPAREHIDNDPRVVVMGVSGCGKSTVGSMLARALRVPFADADSLHPAVNVAKMAAGTPLTDGDRRPWLARVGQELAAAPAGAVVACSALRLTYRSTLRAHVPDVVFVHLDGTRDELAVRMAARLDHFMPPSLLDTQLATLERLTADEAGVVVDIAASPDRITAVAVDWLRTRHAPGGSDSSRSTGSDGVRRRSDMKAGTSAS
ncbi:gluconokinase [Cellulomonas sp. ATA003]|uniref:gluconokinase n=1 Tax=Cellulomonas sp. ATA003 TaxID=3073064 RepID=UPI0028739C45|nr:gluconokinase [Cellulomonas sp. ATA003]WNB87224.1 gluconokinase [Cellulomonas sp. ATA003]